MAAGRWFSNYGVRLSRGFRTLKAWMSIKAHGIDRYRRIIEKILAQAGYLADRIDAHPELERCAPVPLNIGCFRYTIPGRDDGALNALHRELLMHLHESGMAASSCTTLGERYVLRAGITNHRRRQEDVDLLVDEVLRMGRPLKEHLICDPAPQGVVPACWFGSPS